MFRPWHCLLSTNLKEKRPLVAQLDKKLHIIIEPQVTVHVVSQMSPVHILTLFV
jgi:hypothetical protein